MGAISKKRIFSFNLIPKINKGFGQTIGNFSFSLTDSISEKKQKKLVSEVTKRLLKIIQSDYKDLFR